MSFPRTLILFLHGSGGNGLEMSTFFQSVPLEHLEMNTFYQAATRLNVDVVCPTAAKRPYTAMMGQPMNVWFDRSSDFMRQGVEDTEDLAGADGSVAQILALVAEKQAEYEHIFVGGFSMGGCLALHLLRAEADGRLPRAVRGLFSMGSFLVERSAVLGAWTEGPDGGPRSTSSALPVFMMHGTADSLIQHDWGRTTATNLLLKGHDVIYKSYPGVDHEVGEEELVDLLQWVEDVRSGPVDEAARRARQGAALEEGDDEDDGAQITSTAAGGGSAAARRGTKSAVSAEERELQRQAQAHVDAEYQALVKSAEEAKLFTTGPYRPAPAAPAASGDGDGSGGGQKDYVPYTLQQQAGGGDAAVIYFHVPPQKVGMLVSRPVLACGAAFELKAVTIDTSQVAPALRNYLPTPPAPPGGSSGSGSGTSQAPATVTVVAAEVSSADPHATAKEIGKRLLVRLGSDGDSLQACPMS